MKAPELSYGIPKTFAHAAIIVAAVLVVYIPVWQAGFIWDDDQYVTKNVTLRDGAGLKRIWLDIGATPQYYPLVFTTFWIERQMWGVTNPAGYHITNVLLHAANAVLVWIALSRLKVPGAWLGAMLFAICPVHVESVAWVTERKNVLSGLFYLAALLAYFRFSGIDSRNDVPPSRWRFYFLSLIFFAAALLSKTVTCTLPVVLGLILWWKTQPLRVAKIYSADSTGPSRSAGCDADCGNRATSCRGTWTGMGFLVPGKSAHCRSGGVVLRLFHFRADKPDVHLSPMEDRRRAMVAISLPGRRTDRARFIMVLAEAIGKGAASSHALFFVGTPYAGPRICECLSDAVFVCGGPLSISGQYWRDCSRRRGGNPIMRTMAEICSRDVIGDSR